MSQQRSLKRSISDVNRLNNSPKDGNNAPYKRRKQTNEALEALGQLIKNSTIDDLDNDKFNKNDILSLTLSRLLREKYWPSHLSDANVRLSNGIKGSSIEDDTTGFIIVLNSAGRIILISDNVEYYLRKNVRLLYPQLSSIYDCINKEDHQSIREILSTPTMEERRAICTWILPRGKRPNRSHVETKSMLLTGHFFFPGNNSTGEPLFIARCEQILSSTPNIPSNSLGSTSKTTLRFVLNDQLNICEISPNTEQLLGYRAHQMIDQSIYRFLPLDCLNTLLQAKQNCLMDEHCTSMNVLDLYTADGNRLTFLCNTHMLIEGRRRTMKLGFLAQMIDPSIQYDCHQYAQKQNIERQKTSLQQKSIILSNMILNNSTKTNMSMTSTDQCLPINNTQKPKYQRRNYSDSGDENLNFFDASQSNSRLTLEQKRKINTFPTFKQEPGCIDELFNFFDEEKNKPTLNFHFFDDMHHSSEMNNFQNFSLKTPTIAELSFFA